MRPVAFDASPLQVLAANGGIPGTPPQPLRQARGSFSTIASTATIAGGRDSTFANIRLSQPYIGHAIRGGSSQLQRAQSAMDKHTMRKARRSHGREKLAGSQSAEANKYQIRA